MKLITTTIAKALPALGATEDKAPGEIPVVLKLFNPCGAGTWYITEGNLESGELFGLCCIHEAELGYVDLNELQALRLPYGLSIERDLHWEGSLADAMRRENYPHIEAVSAP
jgi:Protein of unknown function (DUF2958)